MILEILENPIDRKTPTKNKSIELENLLNELEKKFHSQVRAFSSAVTTKKKYIH